MTTLLSRIPRPAARPASPFGPDAIEVRPRAVRVGDGWCASFAVTGYPREVARGWLEPLTAHPGRLDVAVHVEPVPANIAAERLRRQLARLESGRRADAAKGRLGDPDVEVAAEDARDLAAGLARGEQKLFRVGLYLTVHARSETQLDAECARVRSVCSSMLLDAQPATWRTLQGWTSTLPVGVDALGQRRSFDTDALAASFPFASAELSATEGVLYGTTTNGSGLVLWDRFAQDNHNSVILARSGAGKSYLAKLEALRSLYAGIEIAVVDPEDEYRRLAETVGGAYVHLGAPHVRVNPFDLAPGPDALTRRALFVHTLISVDVHLHRPRADEQDLADLPAGIALGHEQHDLHFAPGQASGRALGGGPGPRRVAQLAQLRSAVLEQVAGAEPVRGVMGGVQQLPRQAALACGNTVKLRYYRRLGRPYCPARRVRSKAASVAPGPGTAVTARASRGSPQCEQAGTAVMTCPQAVCLVSTGGPSGAAHWSPHCRIAVTTCHRSRPLAVSRYSDRGG
jgi:hypothetical protein